MSRKELARLYFYLAKYTLIKTFTRSSTYIHAAASEFVEKTERRIREIKHNS